MYPDHASGDAPSGSSKESLLQPVAPNGLPIVGTLERFAGRGDVDGFVRGPDGVLAPEHSGRSEVFWEEQTTACTPLGEAIVLDEDGNEWPISACAVDGDGGAV